MEGLQKIYSNCTCMVMGFQEAQAMCAELGMKPDVVGEGSWWVEP